MIGNATTAFANLENVCHLPESQWADKLTPQQLADELIEKVWAFIPSSDRVKAALIESAIDRLRASEKTP